MRWKMQPKGEMRLDCLESSRSMLPKHVKWIVFFHAFSIGSTFWINVEIHFIGIHLEWILHSPNIDVTVCLPNLCHLTAKSPDGPHWWPVPTDTLFSKGWMPSNRGIEAMKQKSTFLDGELLLCCPFCNMDENIVSCSRLVLPCSTIPEARRLKIRLRERKRHRFPTTILGGWATRLMECNNPLLLAVATLWLG